MKCVLILIVLVAGLKGYGQTAEESKKIADKTKAKQAELLNIESIKAAIKKYDALIELNPKNDTAYYKRAKEKVKLVRFTHPHTILVQEIINDYTEVIKLKSKYIAEAYYGRANTKSIDGIRDNYIEDLEKAVNINPKYAQAWFDMGMYYYQAGGDRMMIDEGQNRKSIECFSKVIETNDTLHPAHGAYVFRAAGRELLKDYKGAIEDYNKAIEIDTSDYSSYFHRAWLKDELKDYKGAIEDYTKGIEGRSNDKNFHPGWNLFSRGCIKLKVGDKEGACLDWKKAEKDFVNPKNYMGIQDTISKYCK